MSREFPANPSLAGIASAELIGIPTVPFESRGSDYFSLKQVRNIIVDASHANDKDWRGTTLIAPTLYEFATTFADDLKSSLDVDARVVNSSCHNSEDSIVLTIGSASDYLNAAGEETSEGYTLNVTSSGIVITGASPLGAWWGTRTVLQLGILDNGSVPVGSGIDSPGWQDRGMMLDAGRHFYPADMLAEMCSYMSFFKQNTFHLHLSDNLYTNPNYTLEETLGLYARFRLYSESEALQGLSRYKNESYTREQYDELQKKCAARGVTIISEIEAPGHALPIVQWRPQIGYNFSSGYTGDLSLLNLTHPDAIPTMKLIWSEFLPWFHATVVSIGADEYTGPAADYNDFVNTMDRFIGETANKSTRIWGTFPPKYDTAGYTNIYQNVSIQHWEYFEDNPLYQYIDNNYSVVNSNDNFYVVNKYSGSYPQAFNLTQTFDGNPAKPGGGFWRPYVFSTTNATQNPQRTNKYVLGAEACLWNDWGYNTSVFSEAYWVMQPAIPAIADKDWGGNLTEADFNRLLPILLPYIPGQNLERSIPSKGDVIFNYTMSDSTGPSNSSRRSGTIVVKDFSPNHYDAATDCEVSNGSSLLITPECSLTTPWESKGRNYTLSLSLKVDSIYDPFKTTLVKGADSALMLTPNVTLFASGNHYRLNETIPLGEWVDLQISGRGNMTFASATSEESGVLFRDAEFLTQIGVDGESFVWKMMAIEASLKKITGWTGELSGFSLTNQA